MSGSTVDERNAALTAFLEERTSTGYRVESRTATQAVIVRRRLPFVPARFRRGRGDDRLVVSVDSEGAITMVDAGPRRW